MTVQLGDSYSICFSVNGAISLWHGDEEIAYAEPPHWDEYGEPAADCDDATAEELAAFRDAAIAEYIADNTPDVSLPCDVLDAWRDELLWKTMRLRCLWDDFATQKENEKNQA